MKSLYHWLGQLIKFNQITLYETTTNKLEELLNELKIDYTLNPVGTGHYHIKLKEVK